MAEPMYCPLTFLGNGTNMRDKSMQCIPECAWAVITNDGTRYACVITAREEDQDINSRPLKENA